MGNIEFFPWLRQVKLLIGKRFAGRVILEAGLRHGKVLLCPKDEHLGGHSDEIRIQPETVKQLVEAPDAGSEYKQVSIAAREHLFCVLDQVHAILPDVVEAAHKW